VAGATQSDTDFPLVGSSFQTAFGGGTQDAFVAKFDVNGQLVYSSYLGGDDVDTALGIAVDTAGNFYVTGSTKSALFPTQGAWQSALGAGSGDTDAFVSKFNANGTIAYSSYLGGSLIDIGTGIAVDAAGNAYVSGLTFSANLTTTAGAFQTACGGCGSTVDHSFVAAVKAIPIVASPFLYLTYLSGNNTDEAQSIAVDTTGSAYVVGLTKSTNFPSTPGGFKITAPSGNTFAFVTKLNPTGTALSYSTYLGGNNDTEGLAVAVGAGATPKVYVTGRTASTDFPTTANVPQTTSGGVGDAFVSELDPAASGAASLVISTYLGGSKDDDSSLLAGIAVDGQGNIYVTGDTLSGTNDFPTIPGSWDTAYGGSHDAFVAKYSPQTLAAQFTVDAGTVSPSAISHGSNGTSTVTVTSTGFVGNVNLGCNITPVTAKPPTCSVTTPVALASATDSKTAMLTITTVKTGAASLTGAALWLPIPGMALVGAGLLSHKTRKQKLLSAILGGLAFTGLLLMLACGSGNGTGGGGGGGGGGTTTGSYTVTVTGAANGTNTSGTANFTVQ
jgi:hypothetical protein